MIIRFCC